MVYLFLLNVPMLMLWVMIRERLMPHVGFGRTFQLLPKSWGNSFGAFLVMVLLAFLFFAFTSSAASTFVLLLVNTFVGFNVEARELVFPLFMTFITTAGLFLTVPLLFLSHTTSCLEPEQPGPARSTQTL